MRNRLESWGELNYMIDMYVLQSLGNCDTSETEDNGSLIDTWSAILQKQNLWNSVLPVIFVMHDHLWHTATWFRTPASVHCAGTVYIHNSLFGTSLIAHLPDAIAMNHSDATWPPGTLLSPVSSPHLRKRVFLLCALPAVLCNWLC